MDAGTRQDKPPSVFLTYTHDSVTHRDRVLDLADRLRADGVDAHLDQYESVPEEGWPRWMMNRIEGADFVLVVCTEVYDARFRGQAPHGVGKGGNWEGAVITQELFDREGKQGKFVPILFSREDEKHIPLPLRAATWHVLDDGGGYEQLFRYLASQPAISKPPLGALRTLPPRARKDRDPSFVLTSTSRSPRSWTGRAARTTGSARSPSPASEWVRPSPSPTAPSASSSRPTARSTGRSTGPGRAHASPLIFGIGEIYIDLGPGFAAADQDILSYVQDFGPAYAYARTFTAGAGRWSGPRPLRPLRSAG